MTAETVLGRDVSREGDPPTMDAGVQSTGHLGNVTGLAPSTSEKTAWRC